MSVAWGSRRARLVLHGLLAALWLLGLATAALVAMRQPLFGNDYAFIWGLKGRALLRSGELASLVRVDPMGDFAHPEYPPLWPLLLSTVARLEGGWDDLLLTPLWPLLCLSASLLALRATRGPLAARLAAGAAVSLLPYWRVPIYPGYAEGLFVVFVLAALGEVDRLDRPAPLVRFGAFLTLAALTKNEGAVAAFVAALSLLAAALARPGGHGDSASSGYVLPERRPYLRGAGVALLAPFLLAVIPWQLWLARHLPPGSMTDFSGGRFTAEKAVHVGILFGQLLLVMGWAWILCGLALLVLAPAATRRRAGELLACALYLGAFAGAFVFSRRDLVWHLVTTWDRLLFVPGAVLCVVLAEAAAEALGPGGPGNGAPPPNAGRALPPEEKGSDQLGQPLAGG